MSKGDGSRPGDRWNEAGRGMVLLLIAGFGIFGMPGAARAQQECKFVGWSGDGQAVVEDVNLERSLKCKPRPFNAGQAAPAKGCTPCANKKACAVAAEGAAKAAGDSPDGAVHVESAKDNKAILMVTVRGEAAPRRLALRSGRSAQVTTWFRADSKALAIKVHDAEDRIFVVDLFAATKKERAGRLHPQLAGPRSRKFEKNFFAKEAR